MGSNGGDGGGEQKDIDVILAEAKKKAEESTNKQQKKSKSLKRKRKDSEYGYGGPQKRAKKNSADSSASLDGFSSLRNKSVDSDLLPKVPKFAQTQRKKRVQQPKKLKRVSKR